MAKAKTFRYYITDLNEGRVVGTDDEQVAKDFSGSEDYFVVDSQTGEWLTTEGRKPVKAYKARS